MRPFYHFTPEKGWMNDPNGLFYYKGVYHLFYQHNPNSVEWSNPLSWGHAISKDLLNWEYKPLAVCATDEYSIYSGNGIVDTENVSGLKADSDDPILLFWTKANCLKGASEGIRMSYSTDGGETFKEYSEPIIDIPLSAKKWDRDPFVFYYKPSDKYIMVLYGEYLAKTSDSAFVFFSSDNLLEWKYESEIPNMFECPHIAELSVDNTDEKKWAVIEASGAYMIGDFDGSSFSVCQPKNERGVPYCDYAAQTWSGTGDRVIEISWLRGKPNGEYSQQQSVPAELGLRKNKGLYEITRKPVMECRYKGFEKLSFDEKSFSLEFIVKNDMQDFTVSTFKGDILFSPENRTVSFREVTEKLNPLGDSIDVKIFADVTSLEIFADSGTVYMPFDLTENE